MKNLVIYGLAFFLLAQCCMAATPVQLTGSSGKVVLNSIGANSTSQANETVAGNATNQTGINSLENLWSWGTIPEGFYLDKSGKLVRNPSDTEWNPGI
ncbi:Uncharacterised protein [uncultured archaeon]|nr:Uncharacterised protein [uncultured archaeon]